MRVTTLPPETHPGSAPTSAITSSVWPSNFRPRLRGWQPECKPGEQGVVVVRAGNGGCHGQPMAQARGIARRKRCPAAVPDQDVGGAVRWARCLDDDGIAVAWSQCAPNVNQPYFVRP